MLRMETKGTWQGQASVGVRPKDAGTTHVPRVSSVNILTHLGSTSVSNFNLIRVLAAKGRGEETLDLIWASVTSFQWNG